MKFTTEQLAELVALKARLNDADEATMLGIERALVEIVYNAKQETLSDLISVARETMTGDELTTVVKMIGSAEIELGNGHKIDAEQRAVACSAIWRRRAGRSPRMSGPRRVQRLRRR